MKRFLLLLLAVFIGVAANCQTTYFEGNWATGYNGTQRARLVSVDVSHFSVIATVEFEALRDLRRLDVINYDTCVVSDGEVILELFQTACFEDDGRITLWSADGPGWNNVRKGGGRKTCMLYFSGHLPSTVTRISIIDYGNDKGSHGYCFRNYKIKNERTNYLPYGSESEIRKQIDRDAGGIWKKDKLCGIYEPVGRNLRETLACVKHEGEYYLIYVSSPSNYPYKMYWQVGDIKAKLRRTASNTLIADEWYVANNASTTSGYVTFDDTYMVVTDNRDEGLYRYIKIYPYSSH